MRTFAVCVSSAAAPTSSPLARRSNRKAKVKQAIDEDADAADAANIMLSLLHAPVESSARCGLPLTDLCCSPHSARVVTISAHQHARR